jgi:HTTM domain/Vitamin K-dependent gamma-carboxylase, lumenal domain
MTAIKYLTRYRNIAPLAVFRMAFGAVLFFSSCRFIAKGWVDNFYVRPKFHFPFFGFEWLVPMSPAIMYLLYGLMAIAALFICLGLYYRVATVLFFLIFCYAELLDKTYYLNHYYLVTICSFLLVWVPANRYFSLDVLRKSTLMATQAPSWTILIFKYQLLIIYCCAGLSKLTNEWLIRAMPLKIWLPAKVNIPVLGPFLKYEWTAYLFSWASALFDLTIPFILLNKSSSRFGYFLVIIFHLLTAILFQIGMFPWLMMSATLIYFSEGFHVKLIRQIRKIFGMQEPSLPERYLPVNKNLQRVGLILLACYFFIQLMVPFRYLYYPGNLLWTEQGYRFSWRVMLMEKSGTCFFYVKDGEQGRKFQVNNAEFLTPYQERMVETQPDMILQYAHILKQQYLARGFSDPQVTVESYVSLNGTGSQLYIDSSVNLADEKECWFAAKKWILPYKNGVAK